MKSDFFSKQILLTSCENVGNNHRGHNFTSILVRRQKCAFVHALFTSWNNILHVGCMYFQAPVKLDLFHERYLINYHSYKLY